jgi:hypothetical protein
MKLNLIQTILAIMLSFLIAYGLYSFHDGENKMLLSIGGFVFMAFTSILAIASTFERPRTTTNVKVVSGIFFALAFISNLIFAFLSFSVPIYIITNGISLLVFVLVAYSINKAKQ